MHDVVQAVWIPNEGGKCFSMPRLFEASLPDYPSFLIVHPKALASLPFLSFPTLYEGVVAKYSGKEELHGQGTQRRCNFRCWLTGQSSCYLSPVFKWRSTGVMKNRCAPRSQPDVWGQLGQCAPWETHGHPRMLTVLTRLQTSWKELFRLASLCVDMRISTSPI